MKKINEVIYSWERTTNHLAKVFSAKYFGKDPEQWWVGEEIGTVYFINDYFFSVQDMLDFLRYKYSAKKMFEYLDYALRESWLDKVPVNIKNYKKLQKLKQK